MTRKDKSRLWNLGAVVLSAAMLTGCSGSSAGTTTAQTTSAQKPEAGKEAAVRYKLAATIPMTGNNMQYGISYENALKLAVEDFNAAGGLDGTQVELVVYDDKGDQTEAINVASRIIEDPDVFAVVGSFGSAVSMAIAPVYEEAGMPFISPNTSHVDFPGMGEYLIPISPVKSTEIRTLAETLIEEMGAQDLAIVYANNDTGVISEEAIRGVWTEQGGKIVISENYVPGETQDFTPILSKVKDAAPQIVYLSGGYNDIANILIQSERIGLDNVQFVGPGDVLMQEFLDLVGTSADGIILGATTPVYSDELLTVEAFGEKVVGFMNTYNERYAPKNCDGFAACAYDGAMLAMEAAAVAGTEDSAALVQEMERMEYDCVSAVSMHFENGNTIIKDVCIYTVENGQFKNY